MSIVKRLKTIGGDLYISRETLARKRNIGLTIHHRPANGHWKRSRFTMTQTKGYCANSGVSKNTITVLNVL